MFTFTNNTASRLASAALRFVILQLGVCLVAFCVQTSITIFIQQPPYVFTSVWTTPLALLDVRNSNFAFVLAGNTLASTLILAIPSRIWPVLILHALLYTFLALLCSWTLIILLFDQALSKSFGISLNNTPTPIYLLAAVFPFLVCDPAIRIYGQALDVGSANVSSDTRSSDTPDIHAKNALNNEVKRDSEPVGAIPEDRKRSVEI